MKIYGQYDFDNYILLNPINSDAELKSTAYHEFVHFRLTTGSTVGMLLFCLKKLETYFLLCQQDAEKGKRINSFLFTHTKKLQEGLAVFVECVMQMVYLGEEGYKNFISNIMSNNVYFGYLRPLLFIIAIMRKCDERETILKTANAVFLAALQAMNADFCAVPAESFNKNKSIRKAISKAGFADCFLPDTRFFNIINKCKSANSCDELKQQLYFLLDEETISRTMDIEIQVKQLNKAKSYILELFKDSPNIQLYDNMLREVQFTAEFVEEWFFRQIPSTFTFENLIQGCSCADASQLLDLGSRSYSILLLAGYVPKELAEQIKATGGDSDIISEPLNMLFYYNLKERTGSIAYLQDTVFNKIVLNKNFLSAFIVLYCNYDFVNDVVYGHEKLKHKMTFILFNTIYTKVKEYFDLWKDKKVYIRCMVYHNLEVLIFKPESDRIFIFPMLDTVAKYVEYDIESKRKNMIMTCNQQDMIFDSEVITDENMRDIIDTIINVLYFMDK